MTLAVHGRGFQVALATIIAVALLVMAVAPVWAQSPGTLRPSDSPGSFDSPLDGSSASADAQTDTDAAIRLTVTRFPGVLGPGAEPTPDDDESVDEQPAGEFVAPDGEASSLVGGEEDVEVAVLVENVSDEPLDSLRLAMEVHPPATSRARLHQAFDGATGTQPQYVRTTEVLNGQTIEPGEIAGAALTFNPTDIEWAEDPGGVHPTRIGVTRGADVLTRHTGAIVWLDEVPEDPLITTVLWPLETRPWRGPDGVYPRGVDRDIRNGERLEVLISAAESTDTPLVLAPDAHLLEDLADRLDGFTAISPRDADTPESWDVDATAPQALRAAHTLDRIRALAQGATVPPAASTYADVDLDALVEAGTDTRDLAATATTEGRARIRQLLQAPVDPTAHVVAGPIDNAVLDLLPAEAVVLPPEAVETSELGSASEPVGEPVRRLQAPAGRVLTGLIADPYLHESMGAGPGETGATFAAHRTIAESAMAYFDAAGRADRGLIVKPPADWSPTPRQAQTLADGFGDAPWLQVTSTGTLAVEARRSNQPVQFLDSEHGAFPTSFVTELTAALDSLDGLASALAGSDAITIADDQASPVDTDRLYDDLMRASSRLYRDDGDGAALVRSVQRTVDNAFGDIEVSSGSVTLTSDTGEIPITLQHGDGTPLEVMVTVTSGAGLTWPEAQESEPILLEGDSTQTISFAAQAQSTGAFPVTVEVTDPSGTYELATTTFSVHARANSLNMLGAISALILALLLFGVLRRLGADRDDKDDDGDDGDDPGGAGPDESGRLKMVEEPTQ